MLTPALSRNWQIVILRRWVQVWDDYAEDRSQENNGDILLHIESFRLWMLEEDSSFNQCKVKLLRRSLQRTPSLNASLKSKAFGFIASWLQRKQGNRQPPVWCLPHEQFVEETLDR